LADFIAYAGIAIAVIAVIPLYIDLIQRWRSRSGIEFELEKFYEASADPVESLWSVRILHPSKAIDHCKVFLGDTPLPFWDSHRDRPNYDKKIRASGGANVRIPETIRNDDVQVIVKNREKTLMRMRLADIPRAS
jgi:hypothetical protein